MLGSPIFGNTPVEPFTNNLVWTICPKWKDVFGPTVTRTIINHDNRNNTNANNNVIYIYCTGCQPFCGQLSEANSSCPALSWGNFSLACDRLTLTSMITKSGSCFHLNILNLQPQKAVPVCGPQPWVKPWLLLFALILTFLLLARKICKCS